MMDSIMSFLMKHVGGFFDWWKSFTGLPTKTYGSTQVNWSIVALVVLAWISMFALAFLT